MTIASHSSSTNHLFNGSFADFALPESLVSGLNDMGYKAPTQVQQSTFPIIANGSDVVVQSHTGSGKTTAFCLPILTKVDFESQNVQALVLSPTRELAKQVATECARLAHHTQAKVLPVYGGASIEAQIAALKAGVQIVVGTPGRLRDLIERKALKLEEARILVLDEADEMLSMGFWDDVIWIISHMHTARQTLLFSATLPTTIEHAIDKLLKNPERISTGDDSAKAPTVRHIIQVENENLPKQRNLLSAIEFHGAPAAIVFCNRKEETEVLAHYLRRFGLNAQALNGDMSQNERERVISQLKDRTIDFVIATDIAARGIDISGLTHVFNYELPDNNETYIHRTGRTGRMGKTGTAINLIRSKDLPTVEQLKETYEIQFEKLPLPADEELLWLQGARIAQKLTEEADGVEMSQYRPLAASMLTRGDAQEILTFLIRSHFSKTYAKPFAAPQRPLKPKHEPKPKKPKIIEKKAELSKEVEQNAPIETASIEPKTAPAPLQDLPPTHHTPVVSTKPQRLYITLGKNDGFAELMDLVQYVFQKAQVDMGFFTGMGNMREHSSHLEVEPEAVNTILEALNGSERPQGALEQTPVQCEIALREQQPRKRFFRRR